METIFEGTINGVKYDDITAYNNRIKELINSGEAFSASSCSRQAKEDEVNLFPHGDVEIDETGVHTNTDFIDKGNKLTQGALQDALADKFVPIVEAIQKMKKKDLNDYISKLEALGTWFEGVKSNNDVATKTIKDRLDNTRKKINDLGQQLKHLVECIHQAETEEEELLLNLTYLNKANRTIREWDRAYENTYHQAIDELATYLPDAPATAPDSKDDEQDMDEIPQAIEKLWGLIFGE